MENNIYDLAILGAGPAGICAAIYATRAKLNTIWLDRKFVQGGQIVDTYEVDNYPGLPGITGLVWVRRWRPCRKTWTETKERASSFCYRRGRDQGDPDQKE